ncbi:MAG: PD-(D/E)XK nuclease family protein [Haliea sp.]|nr:PD-(D/E)XK nuclease family protein [Haliea sp.]
MHGHPGIGKVKVTLAIKGDSNMPELRADTLGDVSVGPNGLLRLLETQLGIPARDISFTARLIQYLGCIDRVNHAAAFYHDSYQADPFSVARTLLQWRDQWYLAGWTGRFADDAPARLRDMAAIEAFAADSVEAGLGQRIQRVIALLGDNPVAVQSITLRDELADFPHMWQRLIEAVGAPVTTDAPCMPQGRPGTDLHQLQQQLLHNTAQKIQLRGDGSVLALRADSPQESTPLTVLLMQGWQREAPQKSIALLAEARGDVLDDTLELLLSPRLGFTATSPWRPVFQVLPLACELLWEPLNPTALFQFLSHPVGPIPRPIRNALARTVADTPGIGSAAWEDAITASLDTEEPAQRKKLEKSLRYWLESPRFAPDVGVDSETLIKRAQEVADWLQASRESYDDPARKSLYNIALNQAQEFVHAIARLQEHGRDPLTQDNVRRLIEDVRGTGAPITDRSAEVIPGQPLVLRADHAGAFALGGGAVDGGVDDGIDNVIWWDCQASDRIHRWPWSRSERAALAQGGVLLQSEDEQLAWLGKAWLRPVLCARERCTFILHDDAERHHPLWDQIASSTEGLPVLQVSSSETAAQLGMAVTPLAAHALPPKVRWWQLPESVQLPQREFESFSSLDAYIHSPYQWLLRYGARIRPGALRNVSDGSQLKGSLAHRVYEEFFNAHPAISTINTGAIDSWVDTHIRTLLQQEGALLLEAGRQAECERFITQVQDSLTTLVEHLKDASVASVQMELGQEGQFAGGLLNGSIDLLATRSDGTEAVVDIKWGGRNYRRKSLLANSYLQLATYAQLRRGNGAAQSPALSYFIVMDSTMLSLGHAFFPNAEILQPGSEENAAQYWQRFERTWQWRKQQFDRGLVEVTVSDTEPTADSIPDDDCLDMPEASDAFNDYSALTGWGSNA